jgi:predicted metalloprotease
MRWQNREQSSNVEDRRGRTIKRVGGGIGIGAVLMAILALIIGENPLNVLQQFSQETTEHVATPSSKQEEALVDFVGVVLKETETVWIKLFRDQLNEEYVQPKLVLYSGEDNTGCGYAQSTTGPFYCPADQRVYIDLSFYEELQTRFKAPGDFAMAYIIAHEVGHHVQYLMGITSQVENQRQRMSQAEGNRLSVAMELQADFLAGVWAHHTQKMADLLEKGDIEEALNAASSVGDDRIQMEARGYVVPDAFTHGTSAQRMFWFKKGFETGDLSAGDTFKSLGL